MGLSHPPTCRFCTSYLLPQELPWEQQWGRQLALVLRSVVLVLRLVALVRQSVVLALQWVVLELQLGPAAEWALEREHKQPQ